jgi:hypothetical protein
MRAGEKTFDRAGLQPSSGQVTAYHSAIYTYTPCSPGPACSMGLYLLDYGAGNVQSLANSLRRLGHDFTWIMSPGDFDKATVSSDPSCTIDSSFKEVDRRA